MPLATTELQFIEVPVGEGEAVPFIFDGGDGLVMPLRGTFSTHVELIA